MHVIDSSNSSTLQAFSGDIEIPDIHRCFLWLPGVYRNIFHSKKNLTSDCTVLLFSWNRYSTNKITKDALVNIQLQDIALFFEFSRKSLTPDLSVMHIVLVESSTDVKDILLSLGECL